MDIKKLFVEHFEDGASQNQQVGLELEHFVTGQDGTLLGYYDGVSDILLMLKNQFDKVFYEKENLLGMANDEYSITLEPGAQIEVSVAPKATAVEICPVLNEFYKTISPILNNYNAQLDTCAVIGQSQLDNRRLIPKKRYEYMDSYFKSTGNYGKYMMRGTASTQISVDYSSESDFVKKFRVAYLLSPIFALLSAEQASNDADFLKRITIWNDVDAIRTKPPSNLFDDSFGFASYAQQLTDVPAIFIPYKGEYIYTKNATIGDLAQKYTIDDSLLEHFLSMVFPDVRLKNYIEIRIADSMPSERAVAYADFVSTILYNEEIIEDILKRYKNVGIDDIAAAKLAVRDKGYDAPIYQRCVGDEIAHLTELAAKYGNYNNFSAFVKKGV